MIKRHMFIEKLSKWLSPETCEKLADAAEEYFANRGFYSCYEFMLVAMTECGTEGEFEDMLEDFGLAPDRNDNIKTLIEFMTEEW